MKGVEGSTRTCRVVFFWVGTSPICILNHKTEGSKGPGKGRGRHDLGMGLFIIGQQRPQHKGRGGRTCPRSYYWPSFLIGQKGKGGLLVCPSHMEFLERHPTFIHISRADCIITTKVYTVATILHTMAKCVITIIYLVFFIGRLLTPPRICVGLSVRAFRADTYVQYSMVFDLADEWNMLQRVLFCIVPVANTKP